MVSDACKSWLDVAIKDLGMAEREMTRIQSPRLRYIEGILYHCQQAAEKALKAYLVNNGEIPERTHDLQVLRTACFNFNKAFNNTRLKGHCDYLNNFSVVVRYPDHQLSLDSGHAHRGLNSAKRICGFICERLELKKVYFP